MEAQHPEAERQGADPPGLNRYEAPYELSILVPCLDEEDNVQITLDLIAKVIETIDLKSFEILVLDDASSDATFKKSEDYAASHPELNIRTFRRPEPRRGYGAIVRFGIAYALGEYCVPISGDGVDPVDLLGPMVRKARLGADLVQCSRYHSPEHSATIPFSYKFLQFWWRLLMRLITGEALPDSTYAYKMFRRRHVLALGLSENGFNIGAEIFFKILLSGGSIDYVQSGQGTRRHGKSKFMFSREFFGFSHVMFRTFLHRMGILWF